MAKKVTESQRADSIEQEKKEQKPKKDYGKSSNMAIVEEFLNEKYEFRFNVIKCKPEMLDLSLNEKHFYPVDKYKLNSIKRELDGYNINTSTNALKELFESNFAPAVNPVQDYFKKLPKWDKTTNHIQELAKTVTVADPAKWVEYLTKWLVGVVANAMTNVGCLNHVCLVLTGEQGKFKTTWLDQLAPKTLSNYIFTGKIDPNNKDSLTYIAEFLFINIDDQLRQLNKKDENELKNLITTPAVKYRRPYDPYINEYPHLASFMASVNGNDFLTDPTGSRRFLPFEVLEIDINTAKKINMDLIYSQAITLWKEGFHYWFKDEEVQELHKNNSKFQVITQEEQLIQEFFIAPNNKEAATHYFTNALIQDHLESKTRLRLSPKKIGEALTKLGFEKWQKTDNGITKWVYSIIIKSDELREEEQKNPAKFNRQIQQLLSKKEELPY